MTIGVTGHRFLADRARIDEALVGVVEALTREYPGPWTVVSALAEGADRLVARALLGHPGTRLVAVLPLAVEDYETDFTTAGSRAEFRDLLGRAEETVVLPSRDDRNLAYEAGGGAVLDRSDVLVTVWDGAGEQGVGGTGEIVGAARERGMPIVWVHAGNRRPGTEEPTTLGGDQGLVTWEGWG